MNWYAAHLVMYVERKAKHQDRFPLWENIVLIRADTEDEAFAKAEQRGREDEGDDDGTFRWGDEPACWVFAGVRKLTLCQDAEKRPGDGTEISFTELEVGSTETIGKLLAGEAVTVKFLPEMKAESGRHSPSLGRKA